jgi:HD-like signal output (HDOD) protein/prolyl-tRNA editing enzyme YbaK/EbsC (Cys-tRNA(Pro) deacylase)
VPVPVTILQLLETNKIAYALTSYESQATVTASTPCHVRSQLLEDSHGRVQVLIPAQSMLDLELVAKHLGRQFRPVTRTELSPLLAKQNLTSVPAMPDWQGLPTLVDASILQHSALWLESGDRSQLLAMQSRDFQSLIKNATLGHLAVKLPTISTDTQGDQEDILASVSRFTQKRIQQRLEETLELPPLPDTAHRIIQLRANPNSDISDLAKVVELDPSLAAQVVSWAASPYYSAPGKIKSVQDAIVRVLGFDMVMNLALGLSLGKAFNTQIIGNAQLQTYWRNAVAMAATIEGLVTSIPRVYRPAFGMSYLAGLLHNFGYLILAEVFPPHFANLTRHCDANPQIPQYAVEKHLLGVASCQIAAWLLDAWHLPKEVTLAIRQQFNPHYAQEHQEYAKLIYLAGGLLAQRGFMDRVSHIPSSVFEQLHLSVESAEMTLDNILESGHDLASIAEKMQG